MSKRKYLKLAKASMRRVAKKNNIDFNKPDFDVTLSDLSHIDENYPVLMDKHFKVIDNFEVLQKNVLMGKTWIKYLSADRPKWVAQFNEHWKLDKEPKAEPVPEVVAEKEPEKVVEVADDKPKKKRGRKKVTYDPKPE